MYSGRHRDTSKISLLELESSTVFMPDSQVHTKMQDTKKCMCELGHVEFTASCKHTDCGFCKATESICFSSGKAKKINMEIKETK